ASGWWASPRDSLRCGASSTWCRRTPTATTSASWSIGRPSKTWDNQPQRWASDWLHATRRGHDREPAARAADRAGCGRSRADRALDRRRDVAAPGRPPPRRALRTTGHLGAVSRRLTLAHVLHWPASVTARDLPRLSVASRTHGICRTNP